MHLYSYLLLFYIQIAWSNRVVPFAYEFFCIRSEGGELEKFPIIESSTEGQVVKVFGITIYRFTIYTAQILWDCLASTSLRLMLKQYHSRILDFPRVNPSI